MTLRSKLIRLAHDNPDLRPQLLPLLKEAAVEKVLYTVSINIPKDSARRVQREFDRALDKAIKGMQKSSGPEEETNFWKRHPGVTSKVRD